MRRLVPALAALAATVCPLWPAQADLARTNAALLGRTIRWWSGWDSEQFQRDHSYVYSYHVHLWTPYQNAARGTWAVGADGTVTLTMKGGSILIRKYDVKGDRVIELTGTLDGGADGYFC